MPQYQQRLNGSANNGYLAGSWFDAVSNVRSGKASAGNNVTGAFRFTGVNIPQGTTITSAVLELTGSQNDSGATHNKIQGIAEDNTADFSSDPTGRNRTSANTSWDFNTGVSIDTIYDSPDITSIIQEIINRGGWVSGNALGLIWDNNGSNTGNIIDVYGYDGSSTKCALLTINYTSPTTTSTSTTTTTSTSTSTTTTSSSTSTTTLPPEAYGIYVKKATSMLPRNIPRNFFMNSNYKLLRIHQQGSFQLTVPKGDNGGSLTIAFPGLTYRPMVLVYMQRYNSDGTLDSAYHLLEWAYWGASKVGYQRASIYPDRVVIDYRDQIVEELLAVSFSVKGYYYVFEERVDE